MGKAQEKTSRRVHSIDARAVRLQGKPYAVWLVHSDLIVPLGRMFDTAAFCTVISVFSAISRLT